MQGQQPADQFRVAVVEQHITVQAGYLSKPTAVCSVRHESGIFVHVSSTQDWMCGAITGKGHSTSPLKGGTAFLQALSMVTFGAHSDPIALAVEELDPMWELTQADACARAVSTHEKSRDTQEAIS